MAPTATTKTRTKTKSPAQSTQLKKKKSADNIAAKATPAESAKRKKGEDEPVMKTKKAKVTILEPTKDNKKGAEKQEPKAKPKVVEKPKEKKLAKSKILAPSPKPDTESEAEEPQPTKSQSKSPVKSTSAKQPPKLISANANAKSKSQAKPAVSSVKPTKAKLKAKSPSPALSVSDEEDENGDKDGEDEKDAGEEVSDEEDEEDTHLHGFSTDDDDSSDEEDGEEKPGLSAFEIGKLPTVAKDDESVKRRLEKAKRQPTEDHGVVYIGRLPHGFYEDQLRGYFSQFGEITRLRISRNKKTGKCKHYGFIEFDSSSVAQIVAETMDNYLLTGHILKCKLIPKDEVHPELWIGANRKWRVIPRDRIVRVQHNKPRTVEQKAKANQRLIKRQNARKRKLEALGIEYEFNAVSYKKPKAAKAT
ncbi:hypothetical protein D9756_003146 [Leucocoprinus leucothites]|uniref:RRM domain-containing protein n=1 Tax=Leucocoprinus leucothites TaxID=201217 RepID=A0A8H5G6L9_9AGAR|nr:hypothetical protein D9756_003146 [Leucoagaricus leucothites]